MRPINGVFHDIIKLVPWAAFDKLADEYGTGDAARRFAARNQFLVPWIEPGHDIGSAHGFLSSRAGMNADI